MRGRSTIGAQRYCTILNRSDETLNRRACNTKRSVVSLNKRCLSHETKVLGSSRQECRLALVPIYSLYSFKYTYNYMCFKAFYTGLNNIHIILLINSYDYISLMHTGMFIFNYNFDIVNEVFRQSGLLTQCSPMS